MGRARRIFKKSLYSFQDLSKAFLRESLDCLYYLLYLTATPLSVKLLNQTYESIYGYKYFYQRTVSLCNKGFIKRIPSGKNFKFLFNIENKYKLIDRFLAKRADNFARKWDKKWRLIIYDIPEKKKYLRDKLRLYLERLGFGMVQESCWVSPYNFSAELNDFCRENNLLDYICIYKGEFFAGKSPNTIAKEIWGLDKLYSSYDWLAGKIKGCIREIETKGIDFKDYYKKYFTLIYYYKNTILTDPFLPKDFFKAWGKREEVEKLLEEASKLSFKNLKLNL